MSASSKNGTRIAFTGDFRLRFGTSAKPLQEVKVPEVIVDTLSKCDHVVINLEGPITGSPPVPNKGVVLASDPRAVDVLRTLNCTVVNLGNNHSFDHGVAGYNDTLEVSTQAGWQVFGAGKNLQEAAKPIVLPLKWGRVGMLAVCDRWRDKMAGANRAGVYCPAGLTDVSNRIAALRGTCRWIGINYHGGEELFSMPMPARRRRLHSYCGAGADFVIAHHAHVVQGYERVGQSLIYYGLGDFLFDVDYFLHSPESEQSVVPILEFCRSGEVRYEEIFTRFNPSIRSLEAVSGNRSFRELRASSFDAEYAAFATAMLRQWMVVEGKAGARFSRRVRRSLGVALNLKDRYTRPVLLAAYRVAIATRLHPPQGSVASPAESRHIANLGPPVT